MRDGPSQDPGDVKRDAEIPLVDVWLVLWGTELVQPARIRVGQHDESSDRDDNGHCDNEPIHDRDATPQSSGTVRIQPTGDPQNAESDGRRRHEQPERSRPSHCDHDFSIAPIARSRPRRRPDDFADRAVRAALEERMPAALGRSASVSVSG
jgi:hypothetical protein